MRLPLLLFLLLTGVGAWADEYADLFRQAANYAEQRKYEQAIVSYKAALKIHPGAAEALNNLAVMEYEAKHYAEAFQVAATIWASHPELKSAALIAGMSAVQCHRPNDAIAPLKQLLSTDSANRDALLALASAYVALKEFSEAAPIYEEQTAHLPTDVIAWYGRAICFEQLAEEASKALSTAPGGAGYSKRLLAEYLQSMGDSRLANEAFGESESLAADSSPEAGKLYDSARALAEKSRAAFERLTEVAPESWQAAVFLGDVARQHGDLVSAVAHYKKAADEQPKNPAPMLGLATAYWEMGDFGQASGYLHKILQLDADSQQAIFELANIAVRQHRDKEAIPLLRKYLAAQPDALAARADLGRAYYHLAMYKEAAQELQAAASSDERGDIHYELSVALKKLGRNQEAEAAMAESMTLRKAQLERERRLKAN